MERTGGTAPAGSEVDWFWFCTQSNVLYFMYEEVGDGWWETLTVGGGGGGGGAEGDDREEISDGTRPSV